MSDTCDPRKTGCDCYPFPHRKHSHPERRCFMRATFSFNLGHGMFAAPDSVWTYPTTAWRQQEYTAPLTGLVANKDIDVSIENGQLVLKQDE